MIFELFLFFCFSVFSCTKYRKSKQRNCQRSTFFIWTPHIVLNFYFRCDLFVWGDAAGTISICDINDKLNDFKTTALHSWFRDSKLMHTINLCPAEGNIETVRNHRVMLRDVTVHCVTHFWSDPFSAECVRVT